MRKLEATVTRPLLGLLFPVAACSSAPLPREDIPIHRILLPSGFTIDVYASGIPDARSLALGDEGTVFVGNRRQDKVYAVIDRDRDQRADETRVIARGLHMPNGVASTVSAQNTGTSQNRSQDTVCSFFMAHEKHADLDGVLREVDRARDEIVQFASELIQIPTVNPPGEAYREGARFIGERLRRFGFEVDYPEASDRPEHSEQYPRVNVVGLRRGRSERPLFHLNGHFDVVPVGTGWSVDPFSGLVRDGKLYGRGASDMKAGIAAAVYACEAVRRAGVELEGSLEVSGTVDEETGGFAGVAFLCEQGRISRSRVDHVIIPEPLDVDRICLGHRGVYWFRVTAHGRIAHGSMPFLGESAIDRMAVLLDKVRRELLPELAKRTTATPVVPPGARHATLNVNSILGGQAGQHPQSPCVADHCEAVFDRRFLLEEGFEATKAEIEALLAAADTGDDPRRFELEDLMVVHPVETPESSPLVRVLDDAVSQVVGKTPEHIASPGTYDHKHVARIGGIENCVAYGPGVLELAHQVDEYCRVEDLVNATKVLAVTALALIGRQGG